MKRLFYLFLCTLISYSIYANEYIVFGVNQNLPMGIPNEVILKDYYLSFGGHQGLRNGTIVDVFRKISQINPLSNKKRYKYKVKIGEMKIIHTEESTSIARIHKTNKQNKLIILDIDSILIGDLVDIHIK
jgi:hypothetical protein